MEIGNFFHSKLIFLRPEKLSLSPPLRLHAPQLIVWRLSLFSNEKSSTTFDEDWNHKPERTWKPISPPPPHIKPPKSDLLAPTYMAFYTFHRIVSIMVEMLRSGNRYYLNVRGIREGEGGANNGFWARENRNVCSAANGWMLLFYYCS